MVKLVCKENPSIFIVAPDEFVSEVGGNCWQVGGPQPITYPKHIWEKTDYVSLPSNIYEAAEKYADTQNKNFLNPEIVKNIFKAGAKWLAGQGVSLSHLIAWYIQSVDAHEPVWTEEHIEELVKDYILIPKK